MKYDTIKNKDFTDDKKMINFKFTPVYDGMLETINWFKETHKW